MECCVEIYSLCRAQKLFEREKTILKPCY